DMIQKRYGIEIRAVRTGLTPEMQEQLYGPKLWAREPDRCCLLRKVEPLKAALRGAAAWVTAIRRDQTLERSGAAAVEWDARWGLVKVNPLVGWTRREVWKYILQNGVPYNPLYDRGYASIGCLHCTRPVSDGEDERAGRWSGQRKTECGLHGGNGLVDSKDQHAVASSSAIKESLGIAAGPEIQATV
ncbi:MAG: phosphoadenylyl-sulfate reductase, partial [Blastocatellia bacterium]